MNFKMNVSQYRRKRLLESIMSGDKDKKERGQKIMQNFKKQVIANNTMKEILSESKKSSIFINGFELNSKGKKSVKWSDTKFLHYVIYSLSLELSLVFLLQVRMIVSSRLNKIDPCMYFSQKLNISSQVQFFIMHYSQSLFLHNLTIFDICYFDNFSFCFLTWRTIEIPIFKFSKLYSFVLIFNIYLFAQCLFFFLLHNVVSFLQKHYLAFIEEKSLLLQHETFHVFSLYIVNLLYIVWQLFIFHVF